MSTMVDEIILSNLPSDVIRTIVKVDRFQANYDSLRFISLRWRDLIIETMKDTEQLPAIHEFRWTEDELCWSFFLKISWQNEEYFEIEWPYNKATQEFEEVYYKRTTNKDWLMNRLERLFERSSSIEKVMLEFGLISGKSSFEIGNVKVREFNIKNFCGFKMGYDETMMKFIRRASVSRVVLQLDDKYYNWHANAGSLDSFLSEAIQKTPSIEIITTTVSWNRNQASIRAEWNAKLSALINQPMPVISPVKRRAQRYAGRYRVEPGRTFVEPCVISVQWNNLAINIINERRILPVIEEFIWKSYNDCWHLQLKIPYKFGEFLGIDWRYENNAFSEVFLKEKVNLKWLSRRVAQLFHRCSFFEQINIDIDVDGDYSVNETIVNGLLHDGIELTAETGINASSEITQCKRDSVRHKWEAVLKETKERLWRSKKMKTEYTIGGNDEVIRVELRHTPWRSDDLYNF